MSLKRVISAVVWIAVWILCVMAIVRAQSAPPTNPKYVPTEVQSLRLQLAQQKAITAQQAVQSACGNGVTPGTLGNEFNNTLNALQAEAIKVRTENKWPDTVQFNTGTLAFADAPPPPDKGTTTTTTPPPTPTPTRRP